MSYLYSIHTLSILYLNIIHIYILSMINPKKVHEIHNLSLYYLWNIHTLSIILGLDKCWIKLGSLFHPLFIQIHSLSKLCPRITFSWSKRPIFALSIGYPNPFFIQILSKVYFHMTQETDPCFIQYLSKSFLCLNFVQGLLSVDPRDLSWFYPLFIQIHSLSKVCPRFTFSCPKRLLLALSMYRLVVGDRLVVGVRSGLMIHDSLLLRFNSGFTHLYSINAAISPLHRKRTMDVFG